MWNLVDFTRFWSSIKDIPGSSRWILKLLQDSVLETLLVVDSTIKMTAQNLWNFVVKFGSKAEICWKLEELNRNFFNNSSFKLFVGTYITFLKGYDADYRINTKLSMNYSFGKKTWAELLNTRGAAGEWLITDEFSTDLDEQ